MTVKTKNAIVLLITVILYVLMVIYIPILAIICINILFGLSINTQIFSIEWAAMAVLIWIVRSGRKY